MSAPVLADILPEQTVARMIEQRDAIIQNTMDHAPRDPSGELDEAILRDMRAANAAAEIADYCECVAERMLQQGMPSASKVLTLADQARQLEALHLWHLDGAIPF